MFSLVRRSSSWHAAWCSRPPRDLLRDNISGATGISFSQHTSSSCSPSVILFALFSLSLSYSHVTSCFPPPPHLLIACSTLFLVHRTVSVHIFRVRLCWFSRVERRAFFLFLWCFRWLYFFLLDFPTIHLSFYFACFIYSLCCPVGFIYDPGEWLYTPKKSTTKSGFVDIYEQDWGKKQGDNVLTLKTHCEDIMVGLAAMSRSLLPGLTSPGSGAPWRWLLWWWGVLGDPSKFCVARAVWDTFIEMAMNLNFRTMMLLEF